MKRLPLDRSRAFRESDYPREPNEYTPLRHFRQRFREDDRYLNGEVIESCITEGEIRDNGDGCACFRKIWGGGVAYYLVAGFHERGYRVLVTGWPYVHDRQAALESGRWNSKQLNIIEEDNKRMGKQQSLRHRFPQYSDWMKTA
jgi:hypothetical protein